MYSAIYYALLVHFRLYPILFGLAIVLYITRGQLIPSKQLFVFFIVSAGVFIGLFGVFYALYGFRFAYEWALYHLGRDDPRHSQSVFWLETVYRLMIPGSSTMLKSIGLYGRLALIVFTSWKYRENISLSIYAQTMIFTIFNTVYTVQYAIWELQMLPILAFMTRNLVNWKNLLLLAGCIIMMEISVILGGGLYENLGYDVFVPLHIANIGFVVVRIAMLHSVLRTVGPHQIKWM